MMENTNETIADIRKEAEGRFRKLCIEHVNNIGHLQAMQEFNHVFDRIEAAHKREKAAIEADALTVGGIVAATAKKSSAVGNAAMREALVQCELFLGNVSRHGHPTLNPGDKCTACDGVDELRGMVVRALSAPPRNCDVGSAEEQEERYIKLKREHVDRMARCPAVGRSFFPDSLYWAQMPYEEKEGAGK